MALDNYIMSEAAMAARRKYKREYMRKWRAANKDKVAANNRRYWERKAQEVDRMSRSKTINPDAPYQTPRNAAYLTGLSLWFIREGCKAGTVPHIRVGRDYRINMPMFLEQINKKSECVHDERK